MTDPTLMDHMTRLKLKLLEKRLENEREMAEESAETEPNTARSYDGHEEALQSALRRRKDLLHKLREEQLLEEIARPHTWEGTCRKRVNVEPIQHVSPMHIYHPLPPREPPIHFYPPPPPPPEPPRIIQQQLPQQPATIIQQLPPQQPLITQIPSPQQTLQPARSGSIKEDMVEMMLMQNAQMHQIIMQNMMLKALPPMALTQHSGATPPAHTQPHQDSQFTGPLMLRADKVRPSSVHHHHHYTPPGLPTGPPPMQPGPGYTMWPQMMPANSMGHMGGFPHAVHHVTGPTTTLPAMHTVVTDGFSPRVPSGL
ncbi:uncharacterized protein C21orf58 homolog [Rhinophrynus dorsalis]